MVADSARPDEALAADALLRKRRALSPEEGGITPAIALTAYARPEDRIEALRAGFQMHLAKPVEPAELMASVAQPGPAAPRRFGRRVALAAALLTGA